MDAVLSFSYLLLGAVNLYLIYILINTKKEEAKLVKALFALSDRQKHYIKLLVNIGRIEKTEIDQDDFMLLEKMADDLWLIPLADGALISGEKIQYLAKRLV
ncbi:hypothetical protein [Shewanella xiamenensis]|uniref:hypothetical protein n=1 Tax=Shewanella xiamenensis TaxID=332186 RepID=UPI002E7BBACB|nr:hypothetical protein [Shewanella xiamenensis]MEE1981540.1 hypothetical protein [Shewanella xiamenensis]